MLVHTCFGFAFADGTELIYSVEARRKESEGYNPITKGPFGGYEIIRLFTTFNDLLGFRKIERGQGLERYPLTLSHKQLQQLLQASLQDAARAANATKPDIYHSINNHCTTALLEVMNDVLEKIEKKIPRHIYWHITGMSPRLLAKYLMLDLSKKEKV